VLDVVRSGLGALLVEASRLMAGVFGKYSSPEKLDGDLLWPLDVADGVGYGETRKVDCFRTCFGEDGVIDKASTEDCLDVLLIKSGSV